MNTTDPHSVVVPPPGVDRGEVPARPGVAARILRDLVRGYQAVRAGRPSPCRFHPSCSSYAAEALERHGAAWGAWLALRRVGRCRPFGGQGWDPVPDARSADRIA